MLTKILFVQCSECGWSVEVDDSDEVFDEYCDLDDEEDGCPNCKRLLAEAV